MWEPLTVEMAEINVEQYQVLATLHTPELRFESCPLAGTTCKKRISFIERSLSVTDFLHEVNIILLYHIVERTLNIEVNKYSYKE